VKYHRSALSIRFLTTRLREHRDEARKLAVRAALEKARLLAEGLGARVGKARSITEATDWWGSSYSSWWGRWSAASQNVSVNSNAFAVAGPSSSDETSLAPGRISVTARVEVTFDLE
jgi:uncharacterized protein YggE